MKALSTCFYELLLLNSVESAENQNRNFFISNNKSL